MRSVDQSWSLPILAVVGVLNSAVGAYYYLRIVVLMYLSPAQEEIQVEGGWPLAFSVGTCASLTVVLGLCWGVVAQPAREAAHAATAYPIPEAPAVTTMVESSPTQP